MKKSQTATEYLILLAVVIIIALIVITALGGIPGIGGSASAQTDFSALSSLSVGITEFAVDCHSTDFTIINNENYRIQIDDIYVDDQWCLLSKDRAIIAPGARQKLSCYSKTLCTANENYDYNFLINYTDLQSSAQYTANIEDAVGVTVSGKAATTDVYYLNNCSIISQPGYYYLNQSFNIPAANAAQSGWSCFQVDAEGVTIDANGYSIGTDNFFGLMSNMATHGGRVTMLNRPNVVLKNWYYAYSGFDIGKNTDKPYYVIGSGTNGISPSVSGNVYYYDVNITSAVTLGSNDVIYHSDINAVITLGTRNFLKNNTFNNAYIQVTAASGDNSIVTENTWSTDAVTGLFATVPRSNTFSYNNFCAATFDIFCAGANDLGASTMINNRYNSINTCDNSSWSSAGC